MANENITKVSPIQRLEERVDNLDRRVTVVETSIGDMRRENKAGFESIGNQLNAIYEEKSKWGEWARNNLGRALKWLGAIVISACGINQASGIIKLLMSSNN